MRDLLRNSLRLLLITLIAGVLLGGTYELTKQPIAHQRMLKSNAALMTLFPQAEDFEELSLDLLDASSRPLAAFKVLSSGQTSGYAVRTAGRGGYKGEVEATIGFAADGTISGIEIGQNSETKGIGTNAFESTFLSQFIGKPAETMVYGSGGVDAVSGATMTSNAVLSAVNQAIDCYHTVAEGGVGK